jgi:hypothetical protein
LGGAGTQTAGLAFGGVDPSPGKTTATEEYGGTSWTSGGALPTAKSHMAAAGLQTAALSFGGSTGAAPYSTSTEEYDGSSWTSGGNMNTARVNLAGCGNSNSRACFWRFCTR